MTLMPIKILLLVYALFSGFAFAEYKGKPLTGLFDGNDQDGYTLTTARDGGERTFYVDTNTLTVPNSPDTVAGFVGQEVDVYGDFTPGIGVFVAENIFKVADGRSGDGRRTSIRGTLTFDRVPENLWLVTDTGLFYRVAYEHLPDYLRGFYYRATLNGAAVKVRGYVYTFDKAQNGHDGYIKVVGIDRSIPGASQELLMGTLERVVVQPDGTGSGISTAYQLVANNGRVYEVDLADLQSPRIIHLPDQSAQHGAVEEMLEAWVVVHGQVDELNSGRGLPRIYPAYISRAQAHLGTLQGAVTGDTPSPFSMYRNGQLLYQVSLTGDNRDRAASFLNKEVIVVGSMVTLGRVQRLVGKEFHEVGTATGQLVNLAEEGEVGAQGFRVGSTWVDLGRHLDEEGLAAYDSVSVKGYFERRFLPQIGVTAVLVAVAVESLPTTGEVYSVDEGGVLFKAEKTFLYSGSLSKSGPWLGSNGLGEYYQVTISGNFRSCGSARAPRFQVVQVSGTELHVLPVLTFWHSYSSDYLQTCLGSTHFGQEYSRTLNVETDIETVRLWLNPNTPYTLEMGR